MDTKNIAFNVQLKKTNIANITPNITSESSDANVDEDSKVEEIPRKVTPQLQPEQLSFLNPEPKYYLIKELDQSPVIVSDIDTRPLELKPYHQGGEVKIQIWIDEDGKVVKSKIVTSDLPQAFIDYTLASFNQAKFKAGIKDGKAVRSVAKVVVQYAATYSAIE